MQVSKNKINQYLFFLIISIYTLFNGGNSNILIQINFIFSSILFFYILKDKNCKQHLNNFNYNNRFSLIVYLIFLFYLVLQIIPIPIEFLKFFSPVKYNYLKNLNLEELYVSISLSPTNSFFQIINFITLLIILFILKMSFYNERYKIRFYYFLSLLGFISSTIGVIFYLMGNPDIFFISNSNYKNSSTGFFINRTVFSVFLLFCLLSCLEILRIINSNINKKKDYFFTKIYLRLFIIFITIGIVTSLSRIGNFLLLSTMIFYAIDEFFLRKNKDKSFRYIIIFILIFDIFILGLYFGSSQIIDRFYLLKDEFSNITSATFSLQRLHIIKFGLNEFYNFIFFGYGSGSFETLFQIRFSNSSNYYANHAHSDIIEYLGEFGILGFGLLSLSLLKFFLNKNAYSFINVVLLFYMIIILLFDFSLHIPIIQILFLSFYCLNIKKN